MQGSMPVNVPRFDLRLSYNTAKRRQIETTSSWVVSSSSSCKAGGVTIYRNINGFTYCNRVNIDISEINLGMKDAKAGDAYLVNVKVNGIFEFILRCVDIHLGTALAEIKLFMLRSLLKCSKNITKIIPDYDPDLTTPIMTVGDFNFNVSQDRSLPGSASSIYLSLKLLLQRLVTPVVILRLPEISMYPVCPFCHTFHITRLIINEVILY
ncbi:hypothetical protein TNCV_3404151 [Trichonephila clavipes]|nr:hypothetical protein TNCV_3404151 [Trichonephila clavipes]